MLVLTPVSSYGNRSVVEWRCVECFLLWFGGSVARGMMVAYLVAVHRAIDGSFLGSIFRIDL